MEKKWIVGISIKTKADLWLCGGCTPNVPITITATEEGNIFISEYGGWKQRKACSLSQIKIDSKKPKKRRFFSLTLSDGSAYYFFEDRTAKRPFEFFFTFEASLFFDGKICLN